jgi:hypothetical protein
MTADFIPRADAVFNGWQNILMSNVASRAPALNIPLAEVAALQVLQNRWKTAYAATQDPATCTKGAVKEKQEARDAYEAGWRKLIRTYLTYNPALTDKDREDMGLPIHKTTRTPAPVAATYPNFDIDSSVIRCLSVHFYDQGSKRSKAKPPGQHGAEIKWAILDTPPATIAELSQSEFDTHTPFTLSFEENQRGKTVYFCLCWENTRGEKGPWSEIVSAIIP